MSMQTNGRRQCDFCGLPIRQKPPSDGYQHIAPDEDYHAPTCLAAKKALEPRPDKDNPEPQEVQSGDPYLVYIPCSVSTIIDAASPEDAIARARAEREEGGTLKYLWPAAHAEPYRDEAGELVDA